MSVQQAVFAPDLYNPKPAFAGPCVSVTFYSFSIRLYGPVLTENAKKGALRLVQSALNPFIISRILQKSRRKNAHFGKSTHFSPFWVFFRPFPALGRFAVFSPSPARFPCLLSLCFFGLCSPGSLGRLVPCQSSIDRTTSRGWLWSAFLLPIPYWLLPVSKVWEVCIPYGRGMEKV